MAVAFKNLSIKFGGLFQNSKQPLIKSKDGCFSRDQKDMIIARLPKDFPVPIAGIIADFLIKRIGIGAQEWRDFTGMEVEEPELPVAFDKFWNSVDPIDPTKRVYQTHTLPVLFPEKFTDKDTGVQDIYTFSLLEKFICKFNHKNSFDLNNSCNTRLKKTLKSKGSYWILMRKELIAQSLTYTKQIERIKNLNLETGLNYMESASVFEIATIISLLYACRREQCLADLQYSRCKEGDEHGHAIIGNFLSLAQEESLRSPSSKRCKKEKKPILHVLEGFKDTVKDKEIAIALIKKFPQ